MKATPAVAEGEAAPAITVGVACWNIEGYVGECMASLTGQSFDDFEIVAIDDGSSDGTGEVLDAWAEQDGRLRVVHQQHMGVGAARNEILRLARGRFLTFVDGDDWLAPECLERAYGRAKEDDLDIVSFGWVRIDSRSRITIGKRQDYKGADFTDRDGMRERIFSSRFNQACCALLVKINLFHDHGLYYPNVLHEDMHVTPFLYYYGSKFGHIDENIYFWRLRKESTTQSMSRSHIDGIIGAFHAWKDRLSAEGTFGYFRESICDGMFAYLVALSWRIETFTSNNWSLLKHLRECVLSIPELEGYRGRVKARNSYYEKFLTLLEPDGEPVPAITVGVPCWNVEGYVEECLASLVGQSFENFEIVAIDDGSTDDTGRLLDEWAERDGRVRVAHRRNMGLGPARNEILRLARGRYVTFVDSDDWLAPECLEKADRRAKEGDLDVVTFGWVRFEDGSGRAVKWRHDHRGLDLGDLDGLRKSVFMARLDMLSCARLVRTSLFRDHALLYPDIPHEDIYVTPFLFLYGKRFGYIDEDLYYWRMRDDSIMNTFSRSHIDGVIGIFHAWKSRLSAEERFDYFRDNICNGMFSYFSSLLNKIERIGSNDPDMLRYFRARVRSIPECEAYRLSPEGRQNHAKVVAFLEKGSGKDEGFPLLAAANQQLKNPDARQKAGQVWDIVFAPRNGYHVVTAVPIARLLRERGLRVAFLDWSDVRDEGSLKALKRLGERDCYSSKDFIGGGHGFRVVVVMHDWDPLITRPLVLDARAAGAATVGLIEGIGDFDDVDTGVRRDAYRSVEWVLGAGRHDQHYFGDLGDRFRVVGFPRIAGALTEPYRPPARRQAVINVNFSYNVLEKQRDAWLASAIEGCRLAGMEWVISQHPQDRCDLSAYEVDKRSFEDVMGENAVLISRFSSCIIEALAMGRGVVYHNPGTERVEKFRDPLGAYSVSEDAAGLAAALKVELERLGEGGDRRRRFLEEHCDFSDDFRPHEKAAQALWEIHGQQARRAHRPRERAITRLARNRGPMQLLRRAVHFARRVVAPMPRLAVTLLALAAGLALVGAGVFGGPWGAWPAVGGLVLIGLVTIKEAVLWRRQQRQAGVLARRMQARAQALAEALDGERQRAQQALTEERRRSQRALAEAFDAERQCAQQALTKAVMEERKRSQRTLAKTLDAERRHAQQALTKALLEERKRLGQGSTAASRRLVAGGGKG